MLVIQCKTISAIVKNKRQIAVIYKDGRKVWEAIRSCFGKGYWINRKPWLDSDAWKD